VLIKQPAIYARLTNNVTGKTTISKCLQKGINTIAMHFHKIH